MFQIDSEVFLQRPEEASDRVLHPANVTGVEGGVTIAVDDAFDLSPSQSMIFVLYESNRKFMKMPARVLEVQDVEGVTVVRVEPAGEPVSAESRDCYRVATVMYDFTGDMGDEKGCVLADVSINGFSAILGTAHPTGTNLPVSLHFGAKSFSGTACVQSTFELPGGKVRTGFLCTGGSKDLLAGLRQMSMELQRRQLRRRAG